LGKKSKKSSNSIESDILTATIQTAREEAGLSQREVARRLGFHPTVWGKIERGERVLDVVEFLAVAKALDLDPNELFATFVRSIDPENIADEI